MTSDQLDQDSPDFGLPEGKDEAEFIAEMKTRAQWCFDADATLRELARSDIEFCDVPGKQWDDNMTILRDGRPCYEFNKVRQSVRTVTGDQKQNRPSIKIRAVRDATEEDADVRMGLIRNIEAISNAEQAYDTAFDFAVKGGFGAWRIKTAYADDDTFDQEILIEAIENALETAYCDPSAKMIDRRDARYWFIFEELTRSEFKERYPKADCISFNSQAPSDQWDWNDWFGEETVRIAEYWYKESEESEIVYLSDGKTITGEQFDDLSDFLKGEGITEVQRRTIMADCVYSCIASGKEVLSKPVKWAGKYIPIVPNWGDIIRIRDKDYWSGMVRFARDAQRLYNYERSTLVEIIANAPKEPLLAAEESVKGYEEQYESLGHTNRPVLLYNANPALPNGGMPQRAEPPSFPVALANAANMSSEDIKAVLGIQDANRGAPSNETSGIAILNRKRNGDNSNFVYIDNHAKAIRFTGEILNDLIGKVYDTERVMRILGPDGVAKMTPVNKPQQDPKTGQWVMLNDLSAGKFDIVVDVGPSYTTQRMETAEAMSQISQVPGPFQPLAQYMYLKSLDVPDMEEIQEAARAMLVKQGILPPPEGTPPPQPPPPNPLIQTKAQLQAAQAQKAQAETGRIAAETNKTQVETQQMQAMGPLEAHHAAALTAVELARQEAKIPPLPGDPSVQQPPNRATLPLESPGAM